ncbi:hypothetical protein [Clostridium butyricum]
MGKKNDKVTNLFNDDDVKDLTDFPKEVRRMWVLVTDKGTEDEDFIHAFDTELEALSVGLKINNSHTKSVFEANVNIYNAFGLKIISGYEEL